jgi:hypothetical protein
MSNRVKVRMLSELLGLVVPEELLEGEFDSLATHLRGLSSGQRDLLAARCKRALRTALVRITRTRVAICKTLCAAAPESADVVRRLLDVRQDKDSYEVQFSLFCFLNEVPRIPGARRFAREIPGLVEKYLMNVRAETGRAAWMAGHMMGDHWPKRSEAVRVLTNVVSRAQYAAGRRAAAMALEELLTEDIGSRMRKEILTSLNEVKRSDGRTSTRL